MSWLPPRAIILQESGCKFLFALLYLADIYTCQWNEIVSL